MEILICMAILKNPTCLYVVLILALQVFLSYLQRYELIIKSDILNLIF